MASSTDLKRERCSAPPLSQANLSTSRLGCQITLLDNKTSRLLQIVRQPFDQEFSFNFAIVSLLIFPCHKVHIVNAMRSVSRLSRVAMSSEFLGMLSLARRFNEVLHAREKSLKRYPKRAVFLYTQLQQGANETTSWSLHRCLVK